MWRRRLDELGQDVRGCLRLWRRRPLAATAAVATIALGAGMNIALFRVVWSVMLKPLPYPGAARLVQVWRVDQKTGGFSPRDRRLPDGPTVDTWRERSHSFEGLASYRPWRSTVAGGSHPDRAPAGLVSAEFFPVLGVRAWLGRTFDPAEMRPGAGDAAVLSHAYWDARFGGDRSLVGRSIVVDGQLCRVVGILPPDFRDVVTSSANPPGIYLSISKIGEGFLKTSSGYVVGRLKDGVAAEAAREELAALALEEAGRQGKPAGGSGVNITRLQDEIGYGLRTALLALFAATACVLLIACVNVANLLLSQAVARRQELAVRAALGAGRTRLARQLLTEALVLALAGSLAGVGAAQVLFRSLVAFYPGTLPRVDEGGAGGAVLAFALAATALSAAFFGALPALAASREASAGGLRVGQAWMGHGAGRWQDALVGLQVAVTVTVLVAAGLLLKSFAALRAVDLGFEPSRLVTAQVVLPEARYRTTQDRARFARSWIEGLRAVPGVEMAAVTNSLPIAFNVLTSVRFEVGGRPGEHLAGARAVAGDYFNALGLRMKEGRPLSAADDGREDVVVVNESFARRFLADSPAAGTALRFGPRSATVVGVVRDLRNMGLQRLPEPEIYMPFLSLTGPFLDVIVRSPLPPAGIVTALRSALRELDGGLALSQISSMDRVVDGEIAGSRFRAILLALFASVAVSLAAIGVYGVIAQGVRRRTAEFGVRIALGAGPADVVRLILRQGLRAPLAGAALGMAGAWASGRVVESMLFGVKPHDPYVLAGAAALVLLVCMAGCGLPALRASRVEPATALKHE